MYELAKASVNNKGNEIRSAEWRSAEHKEPAFVNDEIPQLRENDLNSGGYDGQN